MTNVDTSYLLDFSFPDSFNKNSDISIHPITHSAEQSIDRKQAFYLQNWSRGLRASVKRWNQTSFGKDKGTQHWHGKTGWATWKPRKDRLRNRRLRTVFNRFLLGRVRSLKVELALFLTINILYKYVN